jgi:hypothetical protein
VGVLGGGITSTCPTRIKLDDMLLAAMMALGVVPKRLAMEVSVSPALTV